jgi:hypothetical protein
MSKAMTLRLPDEVHESIRREAFERRVPMTAIIQEAIEHRRVNSTIGCDVCGKPHTHISTPGGFRFCDEHHHPRIELGEAESR